MDWRYIEQFEYEGPNQWVRLFPFGTFSRFGRAFEFTRQRFEEMIQNFRNGIPAFQLPLKITHEDDTGKVGNIVDLEIREGGLYGMVDWFERGVELIRDRAFQYISPEAHLDETDWEGQQVSNVLLGAALVNNPYFGETALFSLDDLTDVEYWRSFSEEQRRQLAKSGKALPDGSFPIVTVGDLQNAIQAVGRASNRATAVRHIKKRARALGRMDLIPEDWMSIDYEEEILDEKTVAKNIFDQLKDLFAAEAPEKPEPVEMTVKVEETEEYKALQAEVAEFKAAQEKAAAEAKHKERVDKFAADLGKSFEPLADLPEKLAVVAENHPDEAAYIAQQLKAMAAQVDMVKLFGEIGVGGDPDATGDPATRFVKQAEQMVADGKAETLSEAFSAMARKDPDGFKAYRRESAKREEE